MTGSQVRQQFLDYFARAAIARPSSSLVPANDPTLLFTNAGMNQFKDVFLGLEKRDYSRACSSQKCVRAGGKHNDLENVGYTRRHHTFFEMLGNFSFGDYFKAEAIDFAWELITKLTACPRTGSTSRCFAKTTMPKCCGRRLPAFRRAAFSGSTRRIISGRWARPARADRARRCTTIWAPTPPSPAPPRAVPRDGGGRFVEIWNLVFMQFDRDASGVLTPLPRPSIDTGMGLERIAAVMQGKLSNYDTDLIRPAVGRPRSFSKSRRPMRDGSVTRAADQRRPRARDHLPHQRRRDAFERRPRLRAAQDHAPRAPPRPPLGPRNRTCTN